MSRFSNPADKLILIASVPRKVLNPDVNIVSLSECCKAQLADQMTISDFDRDELLSNISTRLSFIGTLRSVPKKKQFKLLLARFLTHVSRDPIALFAISIMGVI
jgi:hypothetical protein